MKWIDTLTSLTNVDLSYNQITQLPETLGNIPSMKELLLASNVLTKLPESMSQLTSLERLDIEDNSEELKLDDCPLLQQLQSNGCEVVY